MKKTCKVTTCSREHHAKGYCNRHYKKYVKYGSPTAGNFNDTRPAYERKYYKGAAAMKKKATTSSQQQPTKAKEKRIDWTPEPLKERQAPGSQNNLAFFLNQKFIEKIYSEIIKAMNEPLYKSVNYVHIESMLKLCAELAGYNCKHAAVWAEFSDELREWASYKDKIRFMEALGNWEKRVHDYMPKETVQLSFDSYMVTKQKRG